MLTLRLLRRVAGVTLIELMITVAIIAILGSVAYPAFTSYTQRSYRAEAQAQMMDIASRQQRFLQSTRAYADKTTLEATGYALPSSVSSRYSYTISTSSSPPSFTITFTAIGSQTSDGDLTLDSSGNKTPTSKW